MEKPLPTSGPSAFYGTPQGKYRRPSYIYEGCRPGYNREHGVCFEGQALQKIFHDLKVGHAPSKLPRRKKSSVTKADNSPTHRKISVPAVSLKENSEEGARLLEGGKNKRDDWKNWGPYLSERQWGTVREDYSHDGNWSVLVA